MPVVEKAQKEGRPSSFNRAHFDLPQATISKMFKKVNATRVCSTFSQHLIW